MNQLNYFINSFDSFTSRGGDVRQTSSFAKLTISAPGCTPYKRKLCFCGNVHFRERASLSNITPLSWAPGMHSLRTKAAFLQKNAIRMPKTALLNRRAFRLEELSRKSTNIPPTRSQQKIDLHSAYRNSAENRRAFRLQGFSRKSTNIPLTGTQQKIDEHSAYSDSAENRRAFRLQELS